MPHREALIPILERYVNVDPAVAARTLEALSDADAANAMQALPPKLAACVVPHLQVGFAAKLLGEAAPAGIRAVAQSIDPERAAAMIMHMPEDARERLIEHLPQKIKPAILEFLSYPEDSVGRIMHTSFISFHQHENVRDALRKVRALAKKGYPSSYAYVVDEHSHLLGVINMRDLILAPEDDSLATIMRPDVFSFHCFVDQTQAANELSKRRYFAAPVVDSDK